MSKKSVRHIYTSEDLVQLFMERAGCQRRDIHKNNTLLNGVSHCLMEKYHPGVSKRIFGAAAELKSVLSQVQSNFPDANYFVEGESGLHLLLGDSHQEHPTMTMQPLIVPMTAVWVPPYDLMIGGGSF